MAKCMVCGREMLTSEGCGIDKIHINGKIYPRIRMGGISDPAYKQPKEIRCGDCGATIGGCHHWGCDMERCPVCGLQLLICDCQNVYIEGAMEN